MRIERPYEMITFVRSSLDLHKQIINIDLPITFKCAVLCLHLFSVAYMKK